MNQNKKLAFIAIFAMIFVNSTIGQTKSPWTYVAKDKDVEYYMHNQISKDSTFGLVWIKRIFKEVKRNGKHPYKEEKIKIDCFNQKMAYKTVILYNQDNTEPDITEFDDSLDLWCDILPESPYRIILKKVCVLKKSTY